MPNAPWRFPVQPSSDIGLPFDDPNQITPYSPEELQQRQNVMNSQMSLQDALGQQNQQPQGILNSPITQIAVPAALTALSAIFPRHMAIAGPIGMAGYRTAMDTNMYQNQLQRSTVADQARQRLQDFQKQKFKYGVSHDPNIDPTLASSINNAVEVDPTAAEKLYESEAVKSKAEKEAEQQYKSTDPTTLPEGAQQEFSLPGNVKATLKGPPLDKTDLQLFISAHPEMAKADAISAYLQQKKTPSFDERQFQEFQKNNPGKGYPDWLAMKSFAEGANSRSMKAEDESKMIKGMDSYLDMVDQGLFPVTSFARSPKMLEAAAEANKTREAVGKPPVNLIQRGFEQSAIQARMTNMQTGDVSKMLMAATSMNATLDNLEKAYNKAQHLLPTDVTPINDVTLNALAKTGNPDAVRLLSAYVDAKKRAELFLTNGYASSADTEKSANAMFGPGLPSSAFRAALDVTRRNARDIVTMATQIPVVGIDQESPMLKGVNLGPNARPTQMPGMDTSGTGKGERYKTKVDLLKAAKAGEISVEEARAYAAAHGWRK